MRQKLRERGQRARGRVGEWWWWWMWLAVSYVHGNRDADGWRAGLGFQAASVDATAARPALRVQALPLTSRLLPCCRVARRRGEVRPGERGGDAPPPEGAAELLRYPENVTVSNLAYFLAAPTLCYQPVYPRRWAPRAPRVLAVGSGGLTGCDTLGWGTPAAQKTCSAQAAPVWPALGWCVGV